MNEIFRHSYLPYCLIRQEDGSYVVANRNYKPVGLTLEDHVNYAEYPVRVRFKRLTAVTARNLSHSGSENLAQIHLYDDGCLPTSTDANWTAYARRLKILANLKVEVVQTSQR